MEAEYNKQTNFWTNIKELKSGVEGILYIFLGKRLNEEMTDDEFWEIDKEIDKRLRVGDIEGANNLLEKLKEKDNENI